MKVATSQSAKSEARCEDETLPPAACGSPRLSVSRCARARLVRVRVGVRVRVRVRVRVSSQG